MKHLLKKLIFVKIGVSVVTTYMTWKRKNQAVESIEQSAFYKMMRRLMYHPQTRRRNGFFKVSYQFISPQNDEFMIEATVQKQRPADTISLNDSLEIVLRQNKQTIHIKQTVKSKPLIETAGLPRFFKRGLFSLYVLDNTGNDADRNTAYEMLDGALENK